MNREPGDPNAVNLEVVEQYANAFLPLAKINNSLIVLGAIQKEFAEREA